MTDTNEDNGRDERGRFTLGNPGGPGGPRRRASELRRAAEEAVLYTMKMIGSTREYQFA